MKTVYPLQLKFAGGIKKVIKFGLPLQNISVKITGESMGGSRGGGGALKNHKNIGFLCDTGPDSLKNHKATKPAFNVGLSSAASKTPFK